MQIALPINYNYGNSKHGYTKSELKDWVKSQNHPFEIKEIMRLFDFNEEVYLNDTKFENLNVISLRREKTELEREDAFVIRFYKNEIKGEDFYYIETGQFAGVFNYKGITIRISLSEKYNQLVLNHLLSYANNVSIDSKMLKTDYSKIDNELDYILSFLFLQLLEKSSIIGLPQSYKTIKENLPRLKGKINFSNYIKNDIPFKGKISSEYRARREIQEIIDVLYFSLYLIQKKYSSQSLFKVRAIYNELKSKYSKKKPSIDSIRIAKRHSVLSNPIYQQFKKVLELAELIILNLNPEFNSNKSNEISGNLYNTSELFEIYLEKILRNNLTGWQVIPQQKIKIYENQFFARNIIPDIVLHKENKTIVLDAKFKTMNHNYFDVDREDVFQLHTYSYYYKKSISLAALIYPLQNQVGNDRNISSKILDQHDGKFAILGVELNKESKRDSILNSEKNFINTINNLTA